MCSCRIVGTPAPTPGLPCPALSPASLPGLRVAVTEVLAADAPDAPGGHLRGLDAAWRRRAPRGPRAPVQDAARSRPPRDELLGPSPRPAAEYTLRPPKAHGAGRACAVHGSRMKVPLSASNAARPPCCGQDMHSGAPGVAVGLVHCSSVWKAPAHRPDIARAASVAARGAEDGAAVAGRPARVGCRIAGPQGGLQLRVIVAGTRAECTLPVAEQLGQAGLEARSARPRRSRRRPPGRLTGPPAARMRRRPRPPVRPPPRRCCRRPSSRGRQRASCRSPRRWTGCR